MLIGFKIYKELFDVWKNCAIEIHKEDLELVAVCETNRDLLATVSDELGVPGFNNMDIMLQEMNLDMVSICTPSGIHPQQVIKAARAGVHVVTEKPMATRWKDGVEMVRACDDARVRLFVVKQNRRNSILQLLKRAVTEKRFGRIHMVSLNVF